MLHPEGPLACSLKRRRRRRRWWCYRPPAATECEAMMASDGRGLRLTASELVGGQIDRGCDRSASGEASGFIIEAGKRDAACLRHRHQHHHHHHTPLSDRPVAGDRRRRESSPHPPASASSGANDPSGWISRCHALNADSSHVSPPRAVGLVPGLRHILVAPILVLLLASFSAGKERPLNYRGLKTLISNPTPCSTANKFMTIYIPILDSPPLKFTMIHCQVQGPYEAESKKHVFS